jgi:hypothetical protein
MENDYIYSICVPSMAVQLVTVGGEQRTAAPVIWQKPSRQLVAEQRHKRGCAHPELKRHTRILTGARAYPLPASQYY